MKPSTSSNIFKGTSHRADVLNANINVTIPYMPCGVIDLDIVDSQKITRTTTIITI